MQIYAEDCLGCGVCADVCPAKQKALVLKPLETQMDDQKANLAFADSHITQKDDILPRDTLKGSQLQQPLHEFSGACGGCGETPYVKLLTQMFGDRMVIANATGCSSIWGGSSPTSPYATNKNGHGPAWGSSLFEDAAEYGFGMVAAYNQRRAYLANRLNDVLATPGISKELAAACKGWLDSKEDADGSRSFGQDILANLDNVSGELANELWNLEDMFTKKSVWVIGGDGWAYDIGYGGLDHVIAAGEDINLLVLDTEVYSNTGGQASKATPLGSIAKFAAAGKRIGKKDLGAMAMSYGYVYVACVSMGANKQQVIKAFKEAEAYKGPSIVIAYAPCINQGIRKGMGKTMEEGKQAVECGYWPLYRYNPELSAEGKNPFQLESKEPDGTIQDFLKGETRYAALETIVSADEANNLRGALEKEYINRYKYLKMLSELPGLGE